MHYIFHSRILWVGICWCGIAFSVSPSLSAELDDYRVDRIWSAIENTNARSNSDNSQPQGDFDSWSDVAVQCQRLFGQIQDLPISDQEAGRYVRKFGRDGPLSDIRWLLAANDAALPWCIQGPRKYDNGSAVSTHGQLILAKQICEIILQNSDLRSRYLQVVLYSQSFLGQPRSHHERFDMAVAFTAQGFHNGPKEEYWWNGRNFVVLAHATGRDDLLKNTDWEKLTPVFEKWEAWFKENESYLVPDEKYPRWIVDEEAKDHRRSLGERQRLAPLHTPDKPFSDWPVEIVPPKHEILTHLFDYLNLR
jgi:hypothetical protein